MNRTYLTIGIALLAAGLAWFGILWNERSKEMERRTVAALAGKFYGELQLAKSTPRHSLSNRIADMQQTRQQLLALGIASNCVTAARDALDSAMRSYIYVFTEFLAQDRAAWGLSEADAKFAKYDKQIVACKPTPASASD